MSSMDSPHRQRPLAGVDQALGEGRARQPTELLDQLRERLSRLDANHPSAPPWQAENPVTEFSAEANADSEAEPVASPDGSLGQVDLQQVATPAPSQSDHHPARDAGSRDAHRQRRPDAGRDAGFNSSENASESANAPDQGSFEASPGWGRRPAAGNPYRPWFAADEPITPWFAE